MQSVAKRNDGSNIYKLSDHANGDQDTSSDQADDITKKPAATVLNKEPLGLGNLTSLEPAGDEKGAAHEPAAAAPSSADDALAWLKIIQNATADLTADIQTSKGDAFARPMSDDDAPFGRNSPPSSASFAGNPKQKPGLKDKRHDDYTDERELAHRLSYSNAEPWQVPPHTLRAAAMPYLLATGVLAFLAGSAAVSLLMESSSCGCQSEGGCTRAGNPDGGSADARRPDRSEKREFPAGFRCFK